MKDDIFMKAMYGENAIHIPAWMIIQDMGDDAVAFTGASRSTTARYGTDKTHTLIVGELIIRPHIVIASSAYIGSGLSGLAVSGNTLEEWAENGDVIVDAFDRFSKKRKSA